MRASLCYAYMRARRTLVSGAVVFAASVAALMLWSATMTALVEAAPGRWWLDVRDIRVDDAPAGTSPRIHVDRTIRRAFWGRWSVSVWSLTSSPWIACVASSSAEIRYRPGAPNPEGRDLDWWTWPTECQLAPGVYQVVTTWELRVLAGYTTHVTAESNRFRIIEPP